MVRRNFGCCPAGSGNNRVWPRRERQSGQLKQTVNKYREKTNNINDASIFNSTHLFSEWCHEYKSNKRRFYYYYYYLHASSHKTNLHDPKWSYRTVCLSSDPQCLWQKHTFECFLSLIPFKNTNNCFLKIHSRTKMIVFTLKTKANTVVKQTKKQMQ